jgi:YHS domain-containing protein
MHVMHKDPVCGMAVDAARALHLVHAGKPYYFCGAGCRDAFEERPEKYLDPSYEPSMLGAAFDWLRAVLRRWSRR